MIEKLEMKILSGLTIHREGISRSNFRTLTVQRHKVELSPTI